MKIVCVVGIRGSGKTTTITNLIEEFSRRGLRCGTVKTIFCPSFSMDDPKSNTARHRRSGAEIICAKAKRETTFVLPRPLTNREILSFYDEMDYVILEGDYLAPVPRLVAAHGEEDAQPRINELTLAVVGRAATGEKTLLGLPALDGVSNVSALADFLVKNLPDTPLEALDHPLPESELSGDGYCRNHCEHHHS